MDSNLEITDSPDEPGTDRESESAVEQDLEAKLLEIEQRASEGGLSTARHFDPVVGGPSLEVRFSEDEGRRDARVLIGSTERAEQLLETQFEEYRSVSGYSAIFAPTSGDIEVLVRSLGMAGPLGDRPPLDKSYELRGEPHNPGKAITIGRCSSLLSMVTRSGRLSPMRPRPAILLSGFEAETSDEARRLLEEIGASLTFELDLAYGVALQLVPAPSQLRRMLGGRVMPDGPPTFPHNAYDPEPIALYMYGREARGMPLLQFLAFYQAVEFYFPRYSEAEIRHRLELIVKDPRFSPHRDRDIGRLLGAAIGDGRRAGGNEREQLKATIRACIGADEITEFVEAAPARTTFFADRRSTLTKCTISLKDQATDPRDAAANRIYDLRCKIVHTKDAAGQGEVELLLPNSPEARLLHEDIALLQLIATRVIVASSRELRL
jgi:hypothetical protein